MSPPTAGVYRYPSRQAGQLWKGSAQKPGHYTTFLCFLLLAIVLWVGHYYAPLTGCYAC